MQVLTNQAHGGVGAEGLIARSDRSNAGCAPSSTSSFSIVQFVMRPVLPGEKYVVEAYVHAAAGANTPADALQVFMYAFEGLPISSPSPPGQSRGARGKKVGGLLVVGDGGKTLRLPSRTPTPGDAGSRNCFLVDDARLYRTKP